MLRVLQDVVKRSAHMEKRLMGLQLLTGFLQFKHLQYGTLNKDVYTLKAFIIKQCYSKCHPSIHFVPLTHLSWLLLMPTSSGSTPNSLWMSEIQHLSLRPSPAIRWKKLILVACIHKVILSVTTQSS